MKQFQAFDLAAFEHRIYINGPLSKDGLYMAGRAQISGELVPVVRRLSRDFQALRAVARLRILAALAAGESNVVDLSVALRISQPLLSWHLKELRLTGFVHSRRLGREVLYQVVPARFSVLMTDLEALLGFSFAEASLPAASILSGEVEA
ncbi:MAG: metalloregulator ArsR/SmtB family transcription factor [Anaerolineae bacterium]|nr:metalloregulator ArsR/SmtB family transcription factor [Anaerolineae bacterium]